MERILDLHEQIEMLIEERRFKELKALFAESNAIDIAEALCGVDNKDLIVAFRLMDKEQGADAFAAMERDEQEILIHSFTDRELFNVFGDIGVDDAVGIVHEMPANVVNRILRTADRETREFINELLCYPSDSAGSIMTPEYVSLRKEMTVEEAFAKIRRVGLDKETIYTCYVTASRRLIGVVSVRSLLIAEPTARVEELMHENIISVKTTDDKEFVAGQISKYGYLAIPVVDGEDKLVGIVTIDDAIEVIEEEATEDIQKMTAITPDERPYIRSSVFKICKQRAPWLIALMLLSTLTSRLLGYYEDALAACIILNSFIPMIMGTGGNAGSQASVTIIRGLSLGEIRLRDTFKILWKELRVSVSCAALIVPVAFLKVMYLDGLFAEVNGMTIATVISLTLAVTICAAKLVGSLLPIFAKVVHLDPAVMASPFITVIVDALSIVLYFTFASMFIPALM